MCLFSHRMTASRSTSIPTIGSASTIPRPCTSRSSVTTRSRSTIRKQLYGFGSWRKGRLNQKPNVKGLLAAVKQELAKETTDFTVLREGKQARFGDDSQGYVVCAFKDKRDWLRVYLVEYFLTKDSTLQLTISDRAEGFRNTLKAINRVHESFEVSGTKDK